MSFAKAVESRSRRRLDVAQESYFPAYVVWELTLACDHACHHCGSRAVKARASELTVAEALETAQRLAEMGTREVALIGGEAYLHPGFLDIVAALTGRDVSVVTTTGGRGVTPELALKMKQAGMQRVSVSVDGVEATHDHIRFVFVSFRSAMAAIAACREAGLFPSANTNFNRVNQAELEQLYELLRERGVKSWQVQLTAPLGRAADRPEMILQPFDLVELVPRIAQLKERGHREGLLIMPGNNLGYFGPEEALLRSSDPRGKDHFQGCQAGRFLMGIESQGDVKGCPSLQSAHYVGGNLRERPLNDIWDHSQQLAFRRHTADIELWGFCASCPFSRTCRGGCTFTAHSLLGRPGNNPLCHFRARDFQRRGLRERLIPVEVPPGTPFDNGRFDIVLEPWDAPDPPPPSVETLLMPRRKPRRKPSVSQPR